MSLSWQREVLAREDWSRLASDPAPPLLALWADTTQVYALLRGEQPLLVSTAIADGGYPAMSPARPLAAWFERMVHDLWGHLAEGGVDGRPWLDHGRWLHSAPMAVRPGPGGQPEPPGFLPVAEELDQVPMGPVHGLIARAAHLRLAVRGETVVRAELRLGYSHKGTLALMRGKSPRAAARFAARLAGEATVAHSIAFARATEAALATDIPPRAAVLRDIMAELERIATHCDMLASVAEAEGRALDAARHAGSVEVIRRAANAAFGHRLMLDCVVPGGVAADMAAGGAAALRAAIAEVGEGAGLRRLVDALPDGAVSTVLPTASGEGLGHASGPFGDVWHWLSLDHGQIAGAFLCDPAWLRMAELEARLASARLDDVDALLASCGVSGSGMDL